jgi:hypothetical protein
MHGEKRLNLFALFTVVILLASPFVFAGFSEWWNTFTGKATSQSTTLSVAVGNTAPKIENVTLQTPSSGTAPIEAAGLNITYYFNATDADGVANLNDSAASLNLSNTTAGYGQSGYNGSCTLLGDLNSTAAQYACNVTLQYYFVPGIYNVNATIKDINGAVGNNISNVSFTLGTLNAFVLSPAALSWSSVSTSSVNVSSDNDPVTLNNTGNGNAFRVNLTPYDLRGVTTTTEYIYATNFSVDNRTDGCTLTWTNNLTNASNSSLGNTTLNRYDGVTTATGQEEIYYCLKSVNPTLSAQTFDTSGSASWVVRII